MNRKIAVKELIVSLSRYFTAIRKKDSLLLLKNLLFGDTVRIDTLLSESPEDFFMADSLSQLIEKMNERSLFGFKIDEQRLTSEVRFYDAQIERGPAFHNDEQLRRIANYRKYLPYRLQSCKNQKIEDPKAGPLMALRAFLISRKSLGGIQTNLECRVLKKDGTPFQRIYAIGEAAGFGGGGIHGKGSPEGTFLGGCILTAVTFARHLSPLFEPAPCGRIVSP
jgi:predicted oxidoreductase